MAGSSAFTFLAFGIFVFCWNSSLNIAGAFDCNITQGDCVTDQPQKKEACFQTCSRIPDGCKKNIDRFGKQQKYQCHCEELSNCDFANDGSCNDGECMEGYRGPNCQQRLYHIFLARTFSFHTPLFQPNNKKCLNLPRSLRLNNNYRINTILLTTNDIDGVFVVSEGGREEEEEGDFYSELLCVPISKTTAKCKGDIYTNEIVIKGTGATCVRNIELIGCPPELFGENCTKKCHCLNGVTCHQLTGSCPDGCEPGWHGNDCQSPNYENVAKGKFAYISKAYGYPKEYFSNDTCQEMSVSLFANLSIDGNFDPAEQHMACTSSRWMKRPYWYAVLDKRYSINQIRIYNTQTYRSRLKGFVVLVDPSVCFESKNKEHLQDVIDVKCRSVKRSIRIIILLPTTWGQLNLCEVEVLQCLPGFYGDLCKESCDKCFNSQCNQFTGDCTDGCVSGYLWNDTATICEECEYGMFGDNCTKHCHCLDDTPCHHITGSCPAGCPSGYKLPDCQEKTEPVDIILIITVTLVAVLVLVVVVIVCCWCWKKKAEASKANKKTSESESPEVKMTERNINGAESM